MGSSALPESIGRLDEWDLDLLSNGVRIIALRSLGDADVAQDVVQETLERALRALAEGRLRDRGALGGFVRAIARHVIADELRSRNRVVPLDPSVDVPSAGRDPLEALVSAEDADSVRAAVARLSLADRRVIQLSYVDGLTPAAVAERLGEPRARVRKRKSRALEKLRAALSRASARHESGATPTPSPEGGTAPVAHRDGGSSEK